MQENLKKEINKYQYVRNKYKDKSAVATTTN